MNALTLTGKEIATHTSCRPLWRTLRYPKTGPTRINPLQIRLRSTAAEAMPKIAQASTWTSIVPKFMRSRSSPTDPSSSRTTKSKEWNPATFYIVIFMLIGSQAIQMLVLKKDFANYTRRSEAKLRLLAEVIQKIKNGENVDVERLLGTDDEVKEREWEEVLREIEDEDSMWRQKSLKQRDTQSSASNEQDPKPQNSTSIEKEQEISPRTKNPPSSKETARTAKFY